MPEIEIHDVELLKKLTRQAERLAQPHNTANIHWRKAYSQIASGTALLWRLIEQSSGNGGAPVPK